MTQSNNMTTDLDELERLHREATGGEWVADPDGRPDKKGIFDVMSAGEGGRIHVRFVASDIDHEANARFIAAAKNAMPALIAELRALRAENARLHKIFDDAGQGEHNVLALIDHYQQEAENECAERMRIAAAADRHIAEASNKAIEHLEARMLAEAERDALREVTAAATEASSWFGSGLDGDDPRDVIRRNLSDALAKVPR